MIPLKSRFNLWLNIAYTFPQTNPMTRVTAEKLFNARPSSFLTEDLPRVGKILDRSLDQGYLQSFHGFLRTKKGTRSPIFMFEYFNVIFDKEGYIREDFDVDVLAKLRTLLYFFYKLETASTPEKEVEAAQKFKDVDMMVKTSYTSDQIEAIKPVFRRLLPSDPWDIRPRHSNGATADSFSNIDKRIIRRYIPSLMDVYGPQYFFNTQSHRDLFVENNVLEITEPSSRVAFVPKDSRGPRTICMEPHERMFIQKGLMHKIYEFIETSSIASGYVNFTDQSINQRLAYQGSLDNSLSTIDLKDASDMVSWELVSQLVSEEWLMALTACRSKTAVLPDESTVELKKFAPMGSALCFPIEAMIFYSICRLVTDKVWVYGDDIILASDIAQEAIEKLEEYGLIINKDKSLLNGFFKESCGADFYKGYNITPVRYRKDALVSVVELANQLTSKHGEATGLSVVLWFESIEPGIILRLPTHMKNESKFLAFYTDNFSNEVMFRRRWSKDLQRWEIRSLAAKPRVIKTLEHTYDAFFDWLTIKETSNSPSRSYYERLDDEFVYVPDALDYLGAGKEINTSLSQTRYKYCWGSASY